MVALIDGMFVALSQPSGWIWSFAALIATWALAVLLWRSSSTRANLLLFAAASLPLSGLAFAPISMIALSLKSFVIGFTFACIAASNAGLTFKAGLIIL